MADEKIALWEFAARILEKDKSGLNVPTGIYVNVNNEYIIADSANHRIVKINSNELCVVEEYDSDSIEPSLFVGRFGLRKRYCPCASK